MVDQILGSLFGGQQDDDDTRRRERASDFVRRYDEGPPWANISGEEALVNYQQVAERLSPEEYEQAAAEAFARLSPEERQQFVAFMQQRSGAQFSARGDDPNELARMTTQVRQQQSGGLLSLLGGTDSIQALLGGGGAAGALGSLLGGQSQSAGRSRSESSGLGDLINNPIAKSVFAGIAATAMKRIMR